MKTVNLLPKWYRQKHRQRSLMRVHCGFMILIVGVMAAVGVVAREREGVLLLERARMEAQLSQVGDPEAELRVKQSDLRRLEDLQLAYRELGKTIPMSSVIQQIQNDMSQGMALLHVSVDVLHDPVKGSGVVGDAHNPPKFHDVAYLGVEGIAPNDVQIAQLIGNLSANPLFTDVTLDYTRTGTMVQKFMVRRFEIKMKMDLERLSSEDPDAPPGTDTVANGENPHGK